MTRPTPPVPSHNAQGHSTQGQSTQGQPARRRPPPTIRTVGRWHQWATFLFLSIGIGSFGLAWLLGYAPLW